MPKIRCHCGSTIGLGEIPSPNQYLIISDEKYDNYESPVDAENLYKNMDIVVHCNKCGRLYIYWDGFNNEPTIYQIDIEHMSK